MATELRFGSGRALLQGAGDPELGDIFVPGESVAVASFVASIVILALVFLLSLLAFEALRRLHPNFYTARLKARSPHQPFAFCNLRFLPWRMPSRSRPLTIRNKIGPVRDSLYTSSSCHWIPSLDSASVESARQRNPERRGDGCSSVLEDAAIGCAALSRKMNAS
jgi:hypothetical protein